MSIKFKTLDYETETCHMLRIRRDHSATWICLCGHTCDLFNVSKFIKLPFTC